MLCEKANPLNIITRKTFVFDYSDDNKKNRNGSLWFCHLLFSWASIDANYHTLKRMRAEVVIYSFLLKCGKSRLRVFAILFVFNSLYMSSPKENFLA